MPVHSIVILCADKCPHYDTEIMFIRYNLVDVATYNFQLTINGACCKTIENHFECV